MAMNWTIDGDRIDHSYIDTNIKDHVVQGKMIAVSLELTMLETIHFNDDDTFKQVVKERITKLLVDAIMKNKLAEFTFMDDQLSQTKKIHARCYLTKDDQVRILRTHGGFK